MWQRKQTIYLVVVIFLMAITLAVSPLVPSSNLNVLKCLCGTVIICTAIAIGRYKNRKSQQLVCNAGIVFTLCWIGWFCYTHFVAEARTVEQVPLVALLPVVAIVCFFMAKAGIRHDENLIRSMDRIR